MSIKVMYISYTSLKYTTNLRVGLLRKIFMKFQNDIRKIWRVVKLKIERLGLCYNEFVICSENSFCKRENKKIKNLEVVLPVVGYGTSCVTSALAYWPSVTKRGVTWRLHQLVFFCVGSSNCEAAVEPPAAIFCTAKGYILAHRNRYCTSRWIMHRCSST